MDIALEILGGLFLALILAIVGLPLFLRLTEPFRLKLIRQTCEAAGCTDIQVKVFRNHYGVTAKKNGREVYLRCRIFLRRIQWLGLSPENA